MISTLLLWNGLKIASILTLMSRKTSFSTCIGMVRNLNTISKVVTEFEQELDIGKLVDGMATPESKTPGKDGDPMRPSIRRSSSILFTFKLTSNFFLDSSS